MGIKVLVRKVPFMCSDAKIQHQWHCHDCKIWTRKLLGKFKAQKMNDLVFSWDLIIFIYPFCLIELNLFLLWDSPKPNLQNFLPFKYETIFQHTKRTFSYCKILSQYAHSYFWTVFCWFLSGYSIYSIHHLFILNMVSECLKSCLVN